MKCLSILWNALKNKLLNKIFDYIFKKFGKTVQQVNFEKTLKWIIVVLIISSIVCTSLANLSYGKYVVTLGVITESTHSESKTPDSQAEKPEAEKGQDVPDGEDVEGPSYTITTETNVTTKKQVRLLIATSTVLFVLSIVLFVLLMLLKIEKKNHQKTIEDEKRKVQLEIIKQPNKLLEIVEKYDRQNLIPTTWDTSSMGATDDDKKRLLEMDCSMLTQIQDAYKELCLFAIKSIFPHIHDKNPQDTVHVSIKAFYDRGKNGNIDQLGILSLGSADWKGGENAPVSQLFDISKPGEIIKNTHMLAEDPALREAFNPDGEIQVFRLSDIQKHTAAQQLGNKGKKYRKPIYVDREYNATLICPVPCMDNGELKTFGAICVDTTSAYDDWMYDGSYEEELITFIAYAIGPMLGHNCIEIGLADTIIGEKIGTGGKRHGKGRF